MQTGVKSPRPGPAPLPGRCPTLEGVYAELMDMFSPERIEDTRVTLGAPGLQPVRAA